MAKCILNLILGGYVLAQLFGPILAGQIGYRKGSAKHDEMWAARTK